MIAVLNLLRQHMRAGWRYRWMSLALAWTVCGVGWLTIYMMPDTYESTARLYVDTDAVLTPLLHGLALDNTHLNQLEILQRTLLSRPNLEKLISKTSLDLTAANPRAREQLVGRLGKDIKVEAQNRNLFSILYRNHNPQLAQSVVRTILSLYMEQATGSSRTDTENAQQFMDQQIASYEQRLRAAEKRRADFLSKYVDVLPDANGGASRLELARSQVRTLSGDLQDAIARRNMLVADLKTTPSVLTTDPESPVFVGGATTPLAEAERQLQELRLRYTEKNPDVIQARQRVEMLKGGSGSGPTAVHTRSVANPVYEQLKIRLVDANATVTSLERRIRDTTTDRDRLEGIARGEPELQAEATNLDRDYNVLKKDYEELLARRESMRIGAAADREADKMKMSIVDPPVLPRVPATPNRPLLLSGVLLVGIGSGIGLAFVLVQLDQSFATIQSLRNLGRPVLGGVSMRQSAPRKGQVVSALAFLFGVILLIVVLGGLVVGIHGLPKFV
jgi:polysaccharide chain length determinant protein (PEP-CTERM system associated)